MRPLPMILAASAIALSACTVGPMPQTADETRDIVGRGGLFMAQTSFTVPRPVSAVNASLRQGAKQCLNRTVETESWTPGPYGPQYQRSVTVYSTTFQAKGSGGVLAVNTRHPGLNRFSSKPDNAVTTVVDTKAGSGGTTIVISGGRFGAKNMNNAIASWARGETIRCPELI